MTVFAAVAALAFGAAPDPCLPVEALEPDPAGAEEYREVGRTEREAGSRDTAVAAYRAAAARDPSDSASRRALADLCAEQKRDGAYERGVRLMDAGDRRGAVSEFERARAGREDSSSELLEGICLYELGEDDRAEPLLARAERDPEHREAARFFRGLVALRSGRSAAAAALLEASAVDRHLGPMALDLARLARREGRVVVSVLAESGWDSNVDLAPSGAPLTASSSAGLTVAGRAAPFGDSGPFLRANGTYHDEFQYEPLDITGGGGAAGWQAGRGRTFFLGEAGYDYRRLGGDPYLSAPRLLGSMRLGFDRGASVGATYFARWETFLPTAYEAYSGLRHFGEIDATWSLGRRSTATVAWQVGRDVASDPTLSWWETGPRVSLRLSPARRARLGLDATLAVRKYDLPYPGFKDARSDQVVDLSALLEVDVADRLTLRGSISGRRAFSNFAEYDYTKIVPMFGIAYTAGIL